MNTLTKKQQKLYSDLVKEYNANNWQRVCSLDQFLKNKIENCRDIFHHMNLVAVAEFAAEDY